MHLKYLRKTALLVTSLATAALLASTLLVTGTSAQSPDPSASPSPTPDSSPSPSPSPSPDSSPSPSPSPSPAAGGEDDENGDGEGEVLGDSTNVLGATGRERDLILIAVVAIVSVTTLVLGLKTVRGKAEE